VPINAPATQDNVALIDEVRALREDFNQWVGHTAAHRHRQRRHWDAVELDIEERMEDETELLAS